MHSHQPDSNRDGATIDAAALLSRCMDQASVALLVLDKFGRQLAADVERTRSSLRDGDAADLSRVSHSVKGAAGMVSARALCSIASDLEQAARACDLERAAALVRSLAAEADRCLAAIPEARAALARRGGA